MCESRKRKLSSEKTEKITVRKQLGELRTLLNFKGKDITLIANIIDMVKASNRSLLVAGNSPTALPSLDLDTRLIQSTRNEVISAVGTHAETFTSSHDYQRVFQEAPFPLAIAGLDGRFLDCNSKFAEMTGYSRKDILHATLFSTMSAEEIPLFFSAIEKLVSGELPVYQKQRQCIHADGMSYMAQCFISVVKKPSTNEPLYFCCMGMPTVQFPTPH